MTRKIELVTGALAVTLGIVGMAAWVLRVPGLVQVLPGFAVIQFNTALAFALCGSGLAASPVSLPRAGATLGALAGALGLITLSQYATGANLGVDTLFILPFRSDAFSPAGRMSPGTALAFSLCGTAFVVLLRAGPSRWAAAVCAALGAAVIALASFSIIGYVSGLTHAGGYRQLQGMSPQTAAGFVLVGTGLLARAWRADQVKGLRWPAWLPIPIAISVAVFTLSLWLALLAGERQRIEREFRREIEVAGLRVEERIRPALLWLERIAERLGSVGHASRVELERDALRYLRHESAVRAVARTDDKGTIQWAAPSAWAGLLVGRRVPVADWTRQDSPEGPGAPDGSAVMASAGLPLPDATILALSPIWIQDRFDGQLLIAFDVEQALAPVLGGLEARGVQFSVFDKDRLLYRHVDSKRPAGSEYAETVPVRISANVAWTLHARPAVNLVASSLSFLPKSILVFGLLLAALLALSTHLGLGAHRGKARLEAANRELGDEIAKRSRAEQFAIERESRFRTLVESLPHAIVIVDDRGVITEVNSQALRWFGYKREALAGQPVEMLVPERLRGPHAEFRAGFSRDPTARPMGTGRELFALRRDGTEFPVDISLSPIRTERGLEVIAAIADITGRKHMERELRESHERYKALIRSLPVGVMVHRDFQPLLVNTQFAEMLGFESPEEFMDATEKLGAGFYIPTDTRETQLSVHRRRMDGEILPSPVEWETVRKDGKRVWLETWHKIIHWDDAAPAMEAVHIDITERRKARALLQQSEESFRAIFERAPVPMAQMDRQMVFARANQSFANLTGYTVAELTGMSAYAITPEEDRSKIAEFSGRLFSGDVPDTRDVRRVLKKDGSIAYTEATRSVITGRDGVKSIVVMLEDITERLRAEDALRQSEEAFRAIFENAPVSIFSYGRDLRLTRVNRRFADLLGYSAEELIGTSPFALIAPDERAAAEALAHQLFEGKGPSGSIIRGFCTRAGDVLRTEVTRSLISGKDGNPSAVVMLVDITERLRAEAALRESSERFQRIFDEGPVPMTIVDRELNFVRINTQFCRMLGYRPDELSGKNVRDVTHMEDFEHEAGFARDLFDGLREVMNIEKRFVTKDGGVRIAALTRCVLTESSDTRRYAISIIEDITERKRAEQELLAANRELESFAYSVSHDLRQPLRAMSGFSHALAEDYSGRLDETGKDYLRRVEKAVARMTQLIDDLLSLSRITRTELARRPVDVTAMSWAIVEELRTNADEREVDVQIQEQLTVSADPGLLNALMRNLLGNAWKFSGKNPRARIEVGQETRDGETVVFVRDNGVGFDMKYASQLFAPFQRLHAASEFPGTGIGLATVQRVVAKHGGRVWVDSKPGEGTTIRFTL